MLERILTMKAEKTALILIEFQNDFCKEGGKLFGTVKKEIARNNTLKNAVRLLDGTRKKGGKIIHCPFILDRTWASSKDGLLKALADGDVFAPNSWGGKIIDELKPLNDEIVLQGKCCISAFEHTNLATILFELGVENVVVAGFLTNICVQATAWGAYDLGFHTRIIPDSCGAASQGIQEFVEREICPILGSVPTVDDFLAELE